MALIRQPENFPRNGQGGPVAAEALPGGTAQSLGVSFATVNCLEKAKTVPLKMAQRQFEQFGMEQDSKRRLHMNRVDK